MGRKRKSELVVEFMLLIHQDVKSWFSGKAFPFSGASCMLCGNTCYNYRESAVAMSCGGGLEDEMLTLKLVAKQKLCMMFSKDEESDDFKGCKMQGKEGKGADMRATTEDRGLTHIIEMY